MSKRSPQKASGLGSSVALRQLDVGARVGKVQGQLGSGEPSGLMSQGQDVHTHRIGSDQPGASSVCHLLSDMIS